MILGTMQITILSFLADFNRISFFSFKFSGRKSCLGRALLREPKRMWSWKNRWKIRDIRSVFVLWAAFVIIAGKVLMTFCKLWLVLVIQSLYMHCPSTLQCASQSLFSSNFTKTISPNQFQFVFFQASLPLVEPVAVVEAAIDDLIEDRVALERLEEVANMCSFFKFLD